jgi:hypothetical protein
MGGVYLPLVCERAPIQGRNGVTTYVGSGKHMKKSGTKMVAYIQAEAPA